MGQKISSFITDLYNNAPPPNIEGVQYSETPEEEKARLAREALRAQPPSLVSAPTYVPPEDTLRATPGTPNIPTKETAALSDNSTPPALIEGVAGYEGEGTGASNLVAGRVVAGALGAAATMAELPADAADIAYRAGNTLLRSDYKGFGLTDKYREIFVDPAKRASMQLTQDEEVATGSEKLFGALTSGAGSMTVQLATDKALGNAITAFITKRNPAIGALLIATRGGDALARIIPDWVIGMSARRGVENYHDTNDLVAAGAAVVEAAGEGQIMHALPTGPIKGAAGWAAWGVGSRFKEDLRRDEMSSWDEYKFSAAESVGYHIAFSASRAMGEHAQSPVERAYSESILRQLEQDGTVDLRKLDYIINDPTTNDAIREQAGKLKMAIADERALARRSLDPEVLAQEEQYVPEALPSLKAEERKSFMDTLLNAADTVDVDHPQTLRSIASNYLRDVDINDIADFVQAVHENNKQDTAHYLSKIMDKVPQEDSVETTAQHHTKPKTAITAGMRFDTAVADASGRPIRVYHGTGAVYDEYDNSMTDKNGLFGPGHYFTENQTLANKYAEGSRQSTQNVRAVYLRLHNVLDMDAPVDPAFRKIWEKVSKEPTDQMKTNESLYRHLDDHYSKTEINNLLQEAGFDGLTHIGGNRIGDQEHKVWIAFDAKNILPGFSRPEWAFKGPDYTELGDVHRSAANEIQAKVDAGELRQEDAHGDKSWKMFFTDAANRLADQRGTVGPDIGPRPPPPEPAPKETTEQYIARMDKLLGQTKEDIWKARAEQRFNVGQKVKAQDRDNYGEVIDEKINPVTKEAIYTVHFVSPRGDQADVQFTPEHLSPIGKDGKPKVTAPLDPNRPGRHITDEHARSVVEALHMLDQGRPYGDLKNAGALNFYNLGTNQEALAVLAQIHNVAADVIEPTREMGQSLNAIHRTAMGMEPTLDKIRTWYMGTKNLAQKITAARIALLWSATRIAELKIKTLEPDATAEDAAALQEWSKTHINMQEMVEGATSNIARGLGALRIKIEAKDIMGASSPEEVLKIMSRHKAGAANRIISGWMELYKGWMFSNPGTHITNTVGNFAVQIGNTVEDYVAATISTPVMREVRSFNPLGPKKMPDANDRITFIEANAKLNGRMLGWQLSNKYMADLISASVDVYHGAIAEGKTRMDALRLAEDALNLKGTSPYENKYNEDTHPATARSLLGPEDTNLPFSVLMGRRALDLFGMASRSPLTALGLEDNYFREISYTSSISGIATRESFKEKMTDEQRKTFVSGFVKAHLMLFEGNLRTHSIEEQKQIESYAKDGRFHQEAYDQAAKDIFNNDFVKEGQNPAIPNLIEAGRIFLQKAPILQVLWPTYKTPWHILHYITQRTPILNALSAEYRADMAVPGRRRDTAIAKMVYGSMLYTLAATMYLNGSLLPDTDNDLKGTAKALGVKKDSFLMFGKAYQVGQVDPFGSFMSLMARTLYAIHNTVGISNTGDLNLFDQTYDVHGNLMKVPYAGNGGQGWKPAEAISYMLVAGSSLFFDKSVLRQVKDVMNIMGGSPGATKSGAQLLSRTGVGLTLPFNGALRFANGFTNPYLRDAEGFFDNYLSQLHPGAIGSFNGVKPQFDIFGVPVPSMQKWAGFVPQSKVNPQHSPIRALIMHLELPIAEILDTEWRGLQLTEAESLRLNQLVEETGIEQRLNDYIQTQPFEELKPTPGSIGYMTQGSMVLTLIRQARREAMAKLSEETRQQTGTSLHESAVEKKVNIRNDAPSKSAEGLGWDALSQKFMGN